MPDGARETPEHPAANISADFLTGSTEIGLDRIRTRLLDLTNRNKLLNFRHSNVSSLRVVDVGIDQVFGRLLDNDKLAFSPVPEPNIRNGDVPSAKDYLFVSEKLAALEVVRRRLDEVGLGVFCLELHSHKTQKGALLKDLEHRLAPRRSFRDPRDLDHHLSIVEENKGLLTQYAALINKTIEPINLTVFEILWARDQRGHDIPAHRDTLAQLILPEVVHYSTVAFTQAEQLLAVYAQHLTAVLRSCDELNQHPWAWIIKPISFQAEERAIELLHELCKTLRGAERCCEDLQRTTGITVTRTARGLEDATSMLARLPESVASLIRDLLVPCQGPEMRQKIAEFIRNVESFHSAFGILSSCTDNPTSFLDVQLTDELSEALKTLRQWGFEEHSVENAKDFLSAAKNIAELLREAHLSFRVLLDLFGCEAPASIPNVSFLLKAVRILLSSPFDLLHLRQPTFESERFKAILQTAWLEGTALSEDENRLAQDFDVLSAGEMHPPAELLECATILAESSLWERLGPASATPKKFTAA